jgi:hypothetical protein
MIPFTAITSEAAGDGMADRSNALFTPSGAGVMVPCRAVAVVLESQSVVGLNDALVRQNHSLYLWARVKNRV